jgi:hypothetical protein
MNTLFLHRPPPATRIGLILSESQTPHSLIEAAYSTHPTPPVNLTLFRQANSAVNGVTRFTAPCTSAFAVYNPYLCFPSADVQNYRRVDEKTVNSHELIKNSGRLAQLASAPA